MVSDVDTLTMRPRKFIAQLYIIASILYSTDKQRRLKEYKESIFTEDNIVKNYFGDIHVHINCPLFV